LAHAAFPEFANKLKAVGKDLPGAGNARRVMDAIGTARELIQEDWRLKKIRSDNLFF
jgi:hypothetical protein